MSDDEESYESSDYSSRSGDEDFDDNDIDQEVIQEPPQNEEEYGDEEYSDESDDDGDEQSQDDANWFNDNDNSQNDQRMKHSNTHDSDSEGSSEDNNSDDEENDWFGSSSNADNPPTFDANPVAAAGFDNSHEADDFAFGGDGSSQEEEEDDWGAPKNTNKQQNNNNHHEDDDGFGFGGDWPAPSSSNGDAFGSFGDDDGNDAFGATDNDWAATDNHGDDKSDTSSHEGSSRQSLDDDDDDESPSFKSQSQPQHIEDPSYASESETEEDNDVPAFSSAPDGDASRGSYSGEEEDYDSQEQDISEKKYDNDQYDDSDEEEESSRKGSLDDVSGGDEQYSSHGEHQENSHQSDEFGFQDSGGSVNEDSQKSPIDYEYGNGENDDSQSQPYPDDRSNDSQYQDDEPDDSQKSPVDHGYGEESERNSQSKMEGGTFDLQSAQRESAYENDYQDDSQKSPTDYGYEDEEEEPQQASLDYLRRPVEYDDKRSELDEDETIDSELIHRAPSQQSPDSEDDEREQVQQLQNETVDSFQQNGNAKDDEALIEDPSAGRKKTYSREQMAKLAKSRLKDEEDESERTGRDGLSISKSAHKKSKKKHSKKDKKHKHKKSSDSIASSQIQSESGDTKSKKKKKRGKKKSKIKSEALLDLVANVNEAMQDVEELDTSGADIPKESDCRSLMNGFEALVGILLQLSDELELMSTFARAKDQDAIEALDALLSFAPVLDDAFIQLVPVLKHYLAAPVDEELGDLFYGMNLMVDLLCELCHRVGEKQEWNPRACTSFTSLLELLARDSLEVISIFNDVDTPAFEVSPDLADAWNATGHTEEYHTLVETQDLAVFRQIAYQVILSCDNWCPDVDTLMDICGIDETMLEEGTAAPPMDDSNLRPAPEAALQVLEKINGSMPVPRTQTLAHILRRVLPGGKITDPKLLASIVSIRNTMKPVGVPAANMVAISSVPEGGAKHESSLGVAGVGKATLAAMVSSHPDVRRHFSDGIAWIHIGQKELNYTRYVQCLKDVLSQLDIQDAEEPLFPELLQTPGEPISRSRRREEGFMMFVRESVADFLQDRKVLIVLDDVCFDSDLDWFDFGAPPEEAEDLGACCFVLLTTRRRDLLPPADTVEVDVLEEAEAVQLLIQESGDLSQNLAESAETRAVVRECANHPLAVKSVGRWLNLKHATAGSGQGSKEEIHEDVVSSMEKILRSGASDEADMMYEILNMSLSPAINGEPTTIIKFCFAAFVRVFCDKDFISDFALADASPIVPLMTAELLFEALLNLEEDNLRKEGSLFHSNKREAANLIPEALSALGVLKVIETLPEEEGMEGGPGLEKYLQVTHVVQQEYGEYLLEEDISLKDFTVDAERRWNRAFGESFVREPVDWDSETPDAGLDYALEMMPVHMIRGGMFSEAARLLSNASFVRGRLFALGRENGARRHIKDCETLFDILVKQKGSSRKKVDPKHMMKQAYKTLGDHLNMDEDEFIKEEGSPEAVEVGRCHFEIGFSLAEKRCWDAAISHWDTSQELFVSSLGMVEVVAGVLFNVGVVYCQMTEYEQALGALKQCLRIRGAIHGEEHILYAQTIQKIGDVFLAMSDYHEAMESYNWALDVMHIEPSHHRIDIGDILENMGNIHYSKGEIEDSLQCFQDALRSKVADLGQDHPELASIYQHIGDCLSDQGKTDDAVVHFNEAIRLKELDPYGGDERDADVLTIKGVLYNLKGKQQHGLECYEKALQILVTKVSHRKEKVASLLHLIGCVYLVSGEHKKAMKLFEESLQARRKVLGFVHLDVASTLFNMAFLHQTRNRLDKALKCLEEALKIRQLRLPDSEKVALTHEKIGTLARSIGKAKKAEIAFTEALRIRKLIHGDGHVAVASVLQELGDLFDDLGDYNEASKYYREALKIRHNRLGPEDLAVAETFYSMGFTLLNQGALDKALECLEESLSIRKFKLGEDAKECGDTLNTMGFIQAKRNDLEDALQLLWDALRIRKIQGDKIKISETLKNIGNVHREKQEYDLAKECYEECLRVRKEELGESEDDRVADALIAIGNVYSDMNQPAQAMESYQEALAIRSRLFGDSDESVAAVLQYMGTLEFKAKRLDRAFQLLNEFIHIREGNETEPDGDYVNVLFMIGNIHKMQGNEDEAQTCWTEAYKIFKELGLAESNPQIAEVMEKLMRDNEGVADAAAANDEDMGALDDPINPKKKSVFNRLKKKVKGSSSGSGKRQKNKGQQL